MLIIFTKFYSSYAEIGLLNQITTRKMANLKLKILSNASESSPLARLKVLIIRATLARVSASMSISACPPHNSVSRRLPRSPFMINSKTASQPVPRPSHRTVYRQLSRRPNVLACQPRCRPVPWPPLSSLFCSVSRYPTPDRVSGSK